MVMITEALKERIQVPQLVEDPVAFYWLHRQLGGRVYVKYVLPQYQVPSIHSGELCGPFTRRSLSEFLVSKGIFGK